LSSGTPHLGDPFFSNPTKRDFEPRFGFAWDPSHKGNAAIRGGVGLFDVQPLLYQFILLTNQAAPFFSYTNVNSLGTGTFYNGITSFPSNTLRSTYVSPNPKRNYVMQWN